jgi:hypothetical protein
VSYSYDYGYYVYGTFKNLPSWQILVKNELSTSVTLTADGWMENMNIISGDTGTGVIFTNEPKFTAISDGFPKTVDFYIAEDNVMYATIR